LNQIKILSGKATFVSPTELKVIGDDNVVLEAENVIIATGSQPLDIPEFPCDHQRIFNSTSVLELTELPKSMAIIGGGYIGCEFATLYAELGVEVTILEALPTILSLQGKTVAQVMTRAFQNKGIKLMTSVIVEGINYRGEGVSIKIKDSDPVEADLALIAIGRKVNSYNLCLDKVGVQTGSEGEVIVNDKMETNVLGIYAIGDVTGKFPLAHVASHQGIVAASNMIGHQMEIHYNAVPAVIFTTPEIATVGMTLEEAQNEGYTATVGKFPFAALGKSIATIDTEGFAEVVVDKGTGQILGAQVIGHEASTLIAEMALAIKNELTSGCVYHTFHAHPTVAESWMEAALIANGTPIHMPPKR
jgi:dihydrolipoamide dehydrogenase